MYKKVVILGADTFLGYHLARRMTRLGFQVFAFIDKKTNLWRLREIMHAIDIVKVDDLQDHSFLIATIKIVNPDYIFFASSFVENFLHPDQHKFYKSDLQFFYELQKEEDFKFSLFVFMGYCPKCKDAGEICNLQQSKDDNFLINSCIPSIISQAFQQFKNQFCIVKPENIYGEYFSPWSPFGKCVIDLIFNKVFHFDFELIKHGFVHSKDFTNFLVNLIINNPNNLFVEYNNYAEQNFSEIISIFRSIFPGVKLNHFNESFFNRLLLIQDKKDINPSQNNPKKNLQLGLSEVLRWGKRNVFFYQEKIGQIYQTKTLTLGQY